MYGEWNLERVRAYKPNTRTRMVDRQDAISIIQNEFSMTTGYHPFRFLKTRGIGPCVAVGLYEPVTKIAGFMHLQSTSDPFWARNVILGRMKSLGADINQVVAGVMGGEEGRSENTVLKALNALADKNIQVTHLDVLQHALSRESLCIIMDAFDGTYYDMSPTQQGYLPTPNMEARQFFALMGDRIQFRNDPNGLSLLD